MYPGPDDPLRIAYLTLPGQAARRWPGRLHPPPHQGAGRPRAPRSRCSAASPTRCSTSGCTLHRAAQPRHLQRPLPRPLPRLLGDQAPGRRGRGRSSSRPARSASRSPSASGPGRTLKQRGAATSTSSTTTRASATACSRIEQLLPDDRHAPPPDHQGPASWRWRTRRTGASGVSVGRWYSLREDAGAGGPPDAAHRGGERELHQGHPRRHGRRPRPHAPRARRRRPRAVPPSARGRPRARPADHHRLGRRGPQGPRLPARGGGQAAHRARRHAHRSSAGPSRAGGRRTPSSALGLADAITFVSRRDRRAHRRAVRRGRAGRRAQPLRGLLACPPSRRWPPAPASSPPTAVRCPRSPGRDGETVLACPAGDADALAATHRAAGSTTPTLRARVGAAGRQRVVERWSWRHCAQLTVDQYREVLAMPHNQAKLAARPTRTRGAALMLTVRYDRLGLQPGDLLLDLGCGFGRHAFEAARRGRPRRRPRLRRRRAEGGAQHLRRHGRGRRGRRRVAAPARCRATPPACRSPTAPSIASSPPRCSSTSPTTTAALAELARVLRPGGTMAVTVPTWLPEQICWTLSDEYHAPFVDGGHVRIYRAAELRAKLRRGRPERPASPPRPRAALAVLVAALRRRARPTTTTALVRGLPAVPRVGHRQGAPASTRWRRPAAEPGARQEPRRLREEAAGVIRRSAVPEVDGVLTGEEAEETAASIAALQLPCGMIPWFPGGHCDPWNHVETAMALDVAGLHGEAERAYEWLVAHAAPRRLAGTTTTCADGGRGRQARHQRLRLRRHRRVAPLADHRATGASSSTCGRPSSGRSTGCCDLQTAARRDRVGPRGRRPPVDLRAAHRLVVDRPLAALRRAPRRAGRRGPARLGAVARDTLAEVIRTQPDAFAAEGPLGDGLVLPGARRRAHGRRRPSAAWPTRWDHVRDGGPGRALRQRRAVGHRRGDGRVRPRPRRRRRQGHRDRPARLDASPPPRRRLVLDRRRLPRAGLRSPPASAPPTPARPSSSPPTPSAATTPASGLFLGEGLLHVPDDDEHLTRSRPDSTSARAATSRPVRGARRRTRSEPVRRDVGRTGRWPGPAGRSPRRAGGRRRPGPGRRRGWRAGRPSATWGVQPA